MGHSKNQGWEFAHRFSERITRFLRKNERMSNSLKKTEQCAHFWWATWANRSGLLIYGEQPERFANIAHLRWATWAICSHRSFLVSNLSNWLIFLIKKEGMRESLIFKIKKHILNILKNKILDFLSHKLLSESLICSFLVSDLSKLLKVAHLS